MYLSGRTASFHSLLLSIAAAQPPKQALAPPNQGHNSEILVTATDNYCLDNTSTRDASSIVLLCSYLILLNMYTMVSYVEVAYKAYVLFGCVSI